MIDAAAVLAEVRARDLDREGIPMLLALRGAVSAPAGDPRRVTGARLADLLAAVHADLEAGSARVPPATGSESAGPVAGSGTPSPAAGVEPESVAVIEGIDPDAELDLETEAVLAVPPADRALAEAVAVVAHAEARDPGVHADPRHPPAPEPTEGPLAEMLTALREGRWLSVVNYHETPADTASSLADELAEFGRRYSPVAPADMHALITTGRWSAPRPPLIPVLYEGYRSNAEIAAPALEAAGLIGWFFLITGFVDAPVDRQVAFAEAHHIGLAESEAHGRVAMTREQARALADRHVVTAHTTHHAPARRVVSAEAIETELVGPSAVIAELTGRPAVAHAWLFGSPIAPGGVHARRLAEVGYRWVFSNVSVDDVAWAASAAPSAD